MVVFRPFDTRIKVAAGGCTPRGLKILTLIMTRQDYKRGADNVLKSSASCIYIAFTVVETLCKSFVTQISGLDLGHLGHLHPMLTFI